MREPAILLENVELRLGPGAARVPVLRGLDHNVERGETLGRVGMSGRATGPHLCWRMKWRDRNLDPSLLVKS